MQCSLAKYICLSCFILFSYLQADWTSSVDLSVVGQDAINAQVAIDPAGNATTVWSRFDGANFIIQASTKPFGGSWQPTPDNLSIAGQEAIKPQIAVDRLGNATAVWVRFDGSNSIIQASTKPFGGAWQPTPDNLSLTGQDADVPQIAVDPKGNATAVWERSNGSNFIIQASTKPFGGSWQLTPDNLSANGQNANDPQIAVNPKGNATAVWERSNGSNFIIQASTKPFGRSWQTTPDDLSANGQDAFVPQIAVDPKGNATVVWERFDESGNLIIQASSKSRRGSWQPIPDDLSIAGQNADSPQVAVNCAGNATAVWSRSDGSSFIIQASTKPFKGSWQATPDNLSSPGQSAITPQVTEDCAGNATAVWSRSDGSNFIIQASTKPFKGSWQATPDDLSISGENASNPQVATDPVGNVIVTVWQRSNGTNQIIQAAEKITPSAPTHFRGTLARRLHYTKKWLLRAVWKPSQSTGVTYYRVYKGSKLVDIISPDAKLQYTDHLKLKRSAKKFKVAAVNAQNQESARKRLKIED